MNDIPVKARLNAYARLDRLWDLRLIPGGAA